MCFNSIIIVNPTYILQPPSQHARLICYYHNHHPRLLIQPAKIEVVYPDPEIYVIRDLLNDAEMDRLIEIAAPKVVWSYVCVMFIFSGRSRDKHTNYDHYYIETLIQYIFSDFSVHVFFSFL